MARYRVAPREEQSMHCRDGVRLDAHVYRPDGAGPFPVLLMRQPYGRAIASTVTFAHPSWYASHGYIVVIQDVRGRGTSQGEFRLFLDEAADGHDAIDWAAALPGSSGAVGMYGFSYQAMTQYFAASGRHPSLKALSPAMGAWDLHADLAYEGGSLRLQAGVGWALQLATESARRVGNAAAHQALFAAAKTMNFHEATPARPQVLTAHGAYTHWSDWLEHDAADDVYWRLRSPRTVAADLDLPILHVGGWFDALLTGTLAAYRHFAARAKAPQKLVIGPWAHVHWGRRAGQLDHGAEAASTIDRLQLRWFDHWLRGIDTGIVEEPPVQLFELGSNRWRSFAAWPDPPRASFYPVSDGLAAIDPGAGRLVTQPGDAGEDVIVADPWRPAPTLGGHLGFPAGPADRAAVDQRSDCATYTTPPLNVPMAIAGELAVEVFAHADQPSFDLAAILSVVHPEGRVLPLTEGYARVDRPGAPIVIAMRAIAASIPAGAALRLSLQPGSFPAHPVNPGTGEPPDRARLIDERIITITLQHGAGTPSRLLVPLARSDLGVVRN